MLEYQERELESRCSSMITMEVLLIELNAERTAKNQEIDRLKVSLMHTVPTSCTANTVADRIVRTLGMFKRFQLFLLNWLLQLVIDRYCFFRTDTLFVYVPGNRYAEPIFIYCYTCVFDTMITTPLN